MSKKGGYRIIDFSVSKNHYTELTSNIGKATLISGLIEQDFFTTPYLRDGKIILTVPGKSIFNLSLNGEISESSYHEEVDAATVTELIDINGVKLIRDGNILTISGAVHVTDTITHGTDLMEIPFVNNSGEFIGVFNNGSAYPLRVVDGKLQTSSYDIPEGYPIFSATIII